MTNLQELKTVANTGNNKMIMGSLLGDWKGYHKIDGKFYPVIYTDTAYRPYFSVNLLSVAF